MSLRQAVAVILTYKDQLFMVKRRLSMRDFPGYWSFPGGKVEKDEDLKSAAIREIKEELDFVIKEENLILIGEAVAPDFNPQRFHIYFYEVKLSQIPESFTLNSEFEMGLWGTRESFLEMYNRGEALMVPPTLGLLREGVPHVAHITMPTIETVRGVVQIMPLSPTIPPAMRTNAFVIGDVVVDPSPKDENELELFCEELKKYSVKKMFITHHHRDHHHLSEKVRERFDLKLCCSQFTYHKIKEKFSDHQPEFFSEGSILTQWLNQDVLVYEVPGHDRGQLALAPTSLSWFIAGDLFQGIGTVVVGGEDGDMSEYMKTLERVIALNPKALYPSHGIALGGTGILQKTLEHRKLREKQILDFSLQGLSVNEMLDMIYFDLPENIKVYAMANIEAHLKKLQIEGKLNPQQN